MQGLGSFLCIKLSRIHKRHEVYADKLTYEALPPDRLLLDSAPNHGPLISCWELDKLENCWNKSFRSSRILKLLYQQFPNLLISQRDMSGPRLGALANKRWSGGIHWISLKFCSCKTAAENLVRPFIEACGPLTQKKRGHQTREDEPKSHPRSISTKLKPIIFNTLPRVSCWQ